MNKTKIQLLINKIKRKIGSLYFHKGLKMFQEAGDIETSIIHTNEIQKCLKDLGISVTDSVYDRWFYVTSWDNWMDIIANDITHEIKYVKEKKDCDDFAFLFASLASMLYGLTTAPPTFGDTNLGRHYFNIIITKDNGELNAFLYEPIYGTWCRIEKDKELIIGNMIYKPRHLHLF